MVMLNFSLVDSFLEAIPSLRAYKNIHILRIFIPLLIVKYFLLPLYMSCVSLRPCGSLFPLPGNSHVHGTGNLCSFVFLALCRRGELVIL